jgi:hypothetical protein
MADALSGPCGRRLQHWSCKATGYNMIIDQRRLGLARPRKDNVIMDIIFEKNVEEKSERSARAPA